MNPLEIVKHFATQHHQALAAGTAVFALSVAASLLLEFQKPILHWLEHRYDLDFKKLVITFLGFNSFLFSLAGDYIHLYAAGFLPVGTIANYGAYIMAVAVVVYEFGASSAYKKIKAFLLKFVTDVQTAAQ